MSNALMFMDYCKGGKILFEPQLKKNNNSDTELKKLDEEKVETEEKPLSNKWNGSENDWCW